MITIYAVGKTKKNFILEGIKEFEKRISKYQKLKIIILPDVKLTNTINIDIVKRKEADIIISTIKNDNNFKILLDENGNQLDSVGFAKFLNKHNFNVSFIIGGVYGVDTKIKQYVDYVLSFSKMTFTHQFIRLLLVEQIYRAFTIIKGKKYHY